MATNDDASMCKRSAARLGYWQDEFLECFVKNSSIRKPPEINRGYYGRVSAVSHLLHQFLDLVKRKGTTCQVVNLGCGFDTLFWRLKAIYNAHHVTNFVDLDLNGVTMKKVHMIRHKPKLLEHLGDDIKFSATELHSSHYHLVAADLRSLGNSPSADQAFANKLFVECGLRKDLPTVFLCECVLVYMADKESSQLLNWITQNFKHCLFINYEQVNLADRFGEIMLENLKLRNCELLGIEACKSLDTQNGRFLKTNWTSATSWDMNSIYKQHLPRPEIERIEKIEFLDEHDLLEQLLTHYSVTVATKSLKELFHESEQAVGF